MLDCGLIQSHGWRQSLAILPCVCQSAAHVLVKTVGVSGTNSGMTISAIKVCSGNAVRVLGRPFKSNLFGGANNANLPFGEVKLA